MPACLKYKPFFLSLPQGLIDVSKEVSKLEAKKQRLEAQNQKLRDAAGKADYTTKVPEKVRQQNAEKVRDGLTSLILYEV